MDEYLELYPILFPFVIWFGIFFLIGRISGWKNIADIYTPRDIFLHGKQTFKQQSVKVGGVSYNNAINIHTTTEGMQFEVPIVFRFNHPSFFIPWGSITKINSEKFFGTGYLTLTVQQIQKPIIINQKIIDNNYTVPQSITDKLLNRTI